MTSNRTNCVTDHTPEIFDLRETVCERCVDERVKVRPVVEERTVCRDGRAVGWLFEDISAQLTMLKIWSDSKPKLTL